MGKQSDQGRRWEIARRDRWREVGFRSARIERQGTLDQGDVWVVEHPHDSDCAVIEECKATQNLVIDRELEQAVERTGPRTVLAWKRFRKTGGKRRTSFALVAMVPAFYEVLLRAYERLRELDPDFIDRLWEDAT